MRRLRFATSTNAEVLISRSSVGVAIKMNGSRVQCFQVYGNVLLPKFPTVTDFVFHCYITGASSTEHRA